MSTTHDEQPLPDRRRIPAWFERVAKLSWGFIGIVAAVGVVALGVSVLRELVIPLVLAAFFAVVVSPGVDWLERRRVPRGVGSILLMIVIIVVVLGALAMVVVGVIDQADELGERFDEAQAELERLIEQSQFSDYIASVRDSLGSGGEVARDGLGATIGSFLDSAAGFVSGLVLGLVLLYYLLKDGRELLAGMLRARRPETSEQDARIISQAGDSIRGYFRGKTILAAVQGIFVTVVLAVMGVPLPGSIGVVNFIGAYVPFLGAFVGGAFAMLMALSEGGLSLALVALVVVVFMNVVLENVLEPKLLGASLEMHPIVVLLSTVAGGAIAGLAGLVLAAPLTAIGINLYRELRLSGFFDDDDVGRGDREAASPPEA